MMKNTKNKKPIQKITKTCDCAQCITPELAADKQTAQDFKNTLLIVSVVVNVFFLVSWLTLQVASYYSAEAITLVIG